MKKLRWGIVSSGRIAAQFCQDMKFVGNGELAAVAARSLDDAKAFADKFAIAKAYGGYQAMFDDADIDVVYVATPHNIHFQNVHDALMAGKHVLCEKPFTISPQECGQLCALAKARGLFLMEAMWTYFLPAIQKAKAWVEQGRIGQIKHIKADFGYPFAYDPKRREYDAALGGGCLLEIGIYPLALGQFFVGKRFDNIMVKAHLADNGVEDDLVILADAGQARLTLATSYRCKLQNWAYIIGEEGYIAIPDFWRADQCSLYQLDERVDHFADDRASLGFNFEAQAVGEAIDAGLLESEWVSHQTSLWLQQQMQAIKDRFLGVTAQRQ